MDLPACATVDGCVWREVLGECESLTCGQCRIDPSCCNCQDLPDGKDDCCALGTLCNPITGLCEVDEDCCAGFEPADLYECNVVTGICEYVGGG